MDEFKTMEALAKGTVKGVLEKSAEALGKIGKKQLEKIKVDLGLAFEKYLGNSYSKYSTIKTLLHKRDPKKLYKFFEIPKVQKGDSRNESTILAKDSKTVRKFSQRNFIILQGTGGIGKSMLMKHLFLSELKTCEFIPVFFELKDINKQADDYNLTDAIFAKMNDLNTSKIAIEYALERGLFMILLDGFDEMNSDKTGNFTEKLNDFCDKYPDNNVVMSSRPINDFISFEKFTVLDTMGMDKNQAISLIGKLDFNDEYEKEFITALDNELFKKHKGFASNPLLLTMMFLTYTVNKEIPDTPHLFYEIAFETLFSRHDKTKTGEYIREIKSGLKSDLFKKVFATFCCLTYHNNVLSFSKDELENTLNKVKTEVSKEDIDFDVENYIHDLTSAVCMLYREGYTYSFTHRSFQEYFTAVYLKDQLDEVMEKRGLAIIKKSLDKVRNDETFSMLRDMAKNKFEKNIILPLLNDIEQDFKCGNLYDFYFERIAGAIELYGNLILPAHSCSIEMFIRFKYLNTIDMFSIEHFKAGETVSKHLKDNGTNRIYSFSRRFAGRYNTQFVGDDKVLYELMRATHIGTVVTAMSTLRETLTKKYATQTGDTFLD